MNQIECIRVALCNFCRAKNALRSLDFVPIEPGFICYVCGGEAELISADAATDEMLEELRPMGVYSGILDAMPLTTVTEPVKADMVNHPPHYKQHPSGIECIQITRYMNFNLGNVVKYLWRSDHKNGLEDLKKARWYLEDEIKRLEGKNDIG